MSNLHVVYRLNDPDLQDQSWSTYSFPHSIYVGGTSLDDVRAEFREAAESISALAGSTVYEHIERPVLDVPGCYVRVAIDRRTLDRDVARDQMIGSLAVPAQRRDFLRRAPQASTGDIVVVACVGDDPLGWVLEQMTDHDSLGICVAGPSVDLTSVVWWSFLVGELGDRNDANGEARLLSDAGLGGASTIGDFMRFTSATTGGQLLVPSAV